MHFKRNKLLRTRLLPLLAMLFVIGLATSGCVAGLQAVGWSGGAISGDTLFVASKEGKLVAINTADQSRRWSEPLKAATPTGGFGCAPSPGGGCATAPAGVAIYGTPAVSGDLVYIGGYNGKAYAFNSASLATRWIFPRDESLEPIVGGMAVAQGMVFFGDSEGKVYALDAATGDKKWEFETGDKVWSTPTIYGDTLLVSSFDRKLYALNIADGSKRWEFVTEGAIASTPLIHDNTVYFGSFDRYLYAIDAANGTFKWKFMGENWFWATPIAYNNIIYAGCLDNKVYALQADSGNKVAEFDLGSPVSASPVVVNNSIIFASQKGGIYTLDSGTNELRQLANIEKEVYGPLCADRGVVYIHTQDLTLHRLNVNTGTTLTPISLENK